MFPNTDIPSVPAKPETAAASESRHQTQKRFREGRKASKKSFIERNAQDFIELCAIPIDQNQVFDFRNHALFFATGRFSHLESNVKPLMKQLHEFVLSLPERSEGDEFDFHHGPNMVGHGEITAVRNIWPLSAFHLLRFHYVVRAATIMDRDAVTEITSVGSTRNGLANSSIFPSIWVIDPNTLMDTLSKLPGNTRDKVIEELRHEHQSQALPNLFDSHLLTGASNRFATNGTVIANDGKKGLTYGVTKVFADALYSILGRLASEAGETLPPFDMLFKTSDADLKAMKLKYKALTKAEGNIMSLPEPKTDPGEGDEVERHQTSGSPGT